MKAVDSSETLANVFQSTQCDTDEDGSHIEPGFWVTSL
jgi:hypothetical protein